MENDKNPDHGALLLAWEFPSFVKVKRTRNWYIIAGILWAASLIFAIATVNFLFALILIMFALIILFQERQKPSNVRAAITEDGIELGEDFFSYDEIARFWIAYKPPEVKKVYLPFKSAIRPMLVLPLENENPLRIRKILLDYLPEDTKEEDESTSESLSRLLKISK